MRFKVNSPYVVYDVMDDEVVIVNLRLGYYYSVRGAGLQIWEGFAGGSTAEEVVSKLLAAYDADRPLIESSVAQVLDMFRKEEFLVESKETNGTRPASAPLNGAASKKAKFLSPAFEKFTDMEDVLLLDPVHDVDETGWPHPAKASGKA